MIMLEVSFIFDPADSDISKISEVELAIDLVWIFINYLSLAMKLSFKPIAFVC